MKRLVLALALLCAPVVADAQTAPDRDLRERVQQLEDKAALRTLVDTFSTLADQKDVASQLLLFTEDATVDSFSGGQRGSSFKGRKEIGEAFSAYLANFQIVDHIDAYRATSLETISMRVERSTARITSP